MVLVVNDDRDMLDLYRSILEEMGHRPLPRVRLEPKPEVVVKTGADAVILDLQSDIDPQAGLHIIERLRTHPETRDIPIILCTGAAEEAKPLAEHLGRFNVPLVIKPFAVSDFQELLGRVLPQTAVG